VQDRLQRVHAAERSAHDDQFGRRDAGGAHAILR
jgi:hypothetical protein